MTQGNYVLLAWFTGNAAGGLNDCCGWFADANAAWDFYKNSSHCRGMENFQIINVVTWKVVKESEC
jgi:hypothetical protein